MNGIKRSLLVSCLLVLVGVSIQQPLQAGRPGEKLKEVVTWLKDNKEALAGTLALVVAECCCFERVYKLCYGNIKWSDAFSNDKIRYGIIDKWLLISLCFWCRRKIENLSLFFSKNKLNPKVSKLIVDIDVLVFSFIVLQKYCCWLNRTRSK